MDRGMVLVDDEGNFYDIVPFIVNLDSVPVDKIKEVKQNVVVGRTYKPIPIVPIKRRLTFESEELNKDLNKRARDLWEKYFRLSFTEGLSVAYEQRLESELRDYGMRIPAKNYKIIMDEKLQKLSQDFESEYLFYDFLKSQVA